MTADDPLAPLPVDDDSSFKDIAAAAVRALNRLADSLDRAVFVGEAIAVEAGLVASEDVGVEKPEVA